MDPRRGNQPDGKWIPEEGDALVELLTQLTGAGIAHDDIRVISPFRDVVRGAADRARGAFPGARAEQMVGTVRTAQGEESDIVVLVLSIGPKNPGARDWAARRPNLLNVTASRARRRLHVIGNHVSWRHHPNSSELAAHHRQAS